MTSSTPRLSGVRTFLFVGLAVVWFGEGVLTGVQPLAEGWTRFWKMCPPEDATLAAALYVSTCGRFHAHDTIRNSIATSCLLLYPANIDAIGLRAARDPLAGRAAIPERP